MNIFRYSPFLFALPLLASSLVILPASGSAQTTSSSVRQMQPEEVNQELARVERHQSPDWLLVAPHLPDPATASPEALQMAGDVLRARRMPEDALDYYHYALLRGGDLQALRNRIGITQMELRQPELARVSFHEVLKMNPRNAAAWNNLGATDYLAGDYRAAVEHYRRALKLQRSSAIYHSNLGTAYFEITDYESARREFQNAIRLDPTIFDQAGWSGLTAHVLSPHDRGRFCVEMARLSAINHDDAGVIHWLNMAAATDVDSVNDMLHDAALSRYRRDPRVLLILQNAHTLRTKQIVASGPIPPLPPVQAGSQPGR